MQKRSVKLTLDEFEATVNYMKKNKSDTEPSKNTDQQEHTQSVSDDLFREKVKEELDKMYEESLDKLNTCLDDDYHFGVGSYSWMFICLKRLKKKLFG